jgi:hypothetical protein
MNFFTSFQLIVSMVAMFDGEWGPQPKFWKNITYVSNLIAIILKSGIKPVATKLYGNDAYMIHFQTYGC